MPMNFRTKEQLQCDCWIQTYAPNNRKPNILEEDIIEKKSIRINVTALR